MWTISMLEVCQEWVLFLVMMNQSERSIIQKKETNPLHRLTPPPPKKLINMNHSIYYKPNSAVPLVF
jgi:hypothetical protein